jgi:hypothetical protein
MDEKAIEHYKNVLTIDTWHQEKYMSCLSIYESYEKLGREHEGLFYLLESFKYDKKRVECIYRLIKYYCIHGPSEASFMYYSLIQSYYENEYPTETFANKLFVNKEDYDFYLPYYMTITADRVSRPDVCAKMFSYIFKYKYNDKVNNLKMKENSLIIFKGSEIMHKSTAIDDDERRILLSMVFCDICQEKKNVFNIIYEKSKNYILYGE